MRLREFREKANLTTEKLGALVGVSSSAITNWESGFRKPDIVKLVKLAEIFGCTTDELLGFERQAETREEIIARRVAEARAVENPGK